MNPAALSSNTVFKNPWLKAIEELEIFKHELFGLPVKTPCKNLLLCKYQLSEFGFVLHRTWALVQ